jgi:hypothetical protein
MEATLNVLEGEAGVCSRSHDGHKGKASQQDQHANDLDGKDWMDARVARKMKLQNNEDQFGKKQGEENR